VNPPLRLREDAITLFREGISAVDPRNAVRRWIRREENKLVFGAPGDGETELDLSTCRSIFVVGAGKASARMAAAVEELLGDRLTGGVVAIPHGTPVPSGRIHFLHAAHPVPDASGVAAAREVASLASAAGARDLVIAVFSGGGSALLPAPAGEVTLEEKQHVTGLLLRSGATIGEVNTVRKHISFLKGGRLALLAAPARVISLLLSDVIGDDPGTIASGPTAPDATTPDDALRVLRAYRLEQQLPSSVVAHLRQAGASPPESVDPLFARVRNLVVGRNADALQAIASRAERMGYRPVILPGNVQGEAREAAATHVARCREIAGRSAARPFCIVSGGETTVSVRGTGRGGRNQEFALAAAIAMEGWEDTVLLSAGTDGIDGNTTAAGAIVDGGTIGSGRALGLLAEEFLLQNDSNSFFFGLNQLLVTGATGTNVMDVQILVGE
jgi:hydroxypyruvate reductase